MALLTEADASLRSDLLLRATAVGGRTVLGTVAGQGQLVARQTGEGRVHLVGQAAGPLNGDELDVRIEVGAGARLHVASAAATIALPSDRIGAVSRIRITATVGEGAELLWMPDPLVVATGAVVKVSTLLQVAATARLSYAEAIVLGRHGEAGGSVRSGLRVERDGALELAQTLDSTILDRPDRAERVVVSMLQVRSEPWPVPAAVGAAAVALQPAPGVLLASATGSQYESARTALAAVVDLAHLA